MKEGDAYNFVSYMCRNTLFVTIIYCILIGVIGNIVLKVLFGVRFLPSLMPMLLLLPGIVGLAINKVLCSGFSGLGKPEFGTYTVTCSSIATIILDLLLIPKMGINGAAIASSIAYIVSAISGVVIFTRLSGIGMGKLLFVKRQDLTKYPSLYKKILKRIKGE